jgi:hypothetical protein
MPRSQAQSDFSVARAPEIQLPAVAAPVALSPADRSQASALATRWILRLTVAALAVLAVLCAVGPHIPAGE